MRFLVTFSSFVCFCTFFLRFACFSVFRAFSFLAFLWAPRGSHPPSLLGPCRRFSSLLVALHTFSGLRQFVYSLRSLVALYPLSCAQDVRFSSPRPGILRAFVEATFSDLVHSALIQRAPFSPFPAPWITFRRSTSHSSLRIS